MTIERDCFWFKTGTGYLIYYRKGEGVTVEREPRADPEEEQLWLNGSTYAAIAAINGYLPVHASAVAWRGRAYAFAGPSGAGKSTLAAALGHHGLPLVCDDMAALYQWMPAARLGACPNAEKTPDCALPGDSRTAQVTMAQPARPACLDRSQWHRCFGRPARTVDSGSAPSVEFKPLF